MSFFFLSLLLRTKNKLISQRIAAPKDLPQAGWQGRSKKSYDGTQRRSADPLLWFSRSTTLEEGAQSGLVSKHQELLISLLQLSVDPK